MSQADDREERAQALVENEDEILVVGDLIDETLSEFREHYHKLPEQDHLISSLETTLTGTVDEDDMDEVLYPVLNFILNYNTEEIRNLRRQGASEELLRLMGRLGMKYQSYILKVRRKWFQGPNFLLDHEVDIVRRGPTNFPGINHTFQSGDDDEIELTMSLTSNLRLARNILQAQNRALRNVPEEAREEIPKEFIDGLREELNTIQEQLNLED